ncbi:hypothetical protein KBY96_09760 [Cyanobium sp. ATX 6A2]|uniref:hypothetical protein n=1 Tax=Cyanobium sp. ATX 6A2 TaxID=2823700 RepID=UPI0020CDCACA|nr:hypothetical protein [Cyanobium sp. ATX 6A2]MCP9888211.1 hypothetical protein [Cyanobium sp. ATX 6A2]
MASLTADQLDDLQAFLKDWLRHAGRTQSDLRRALKAGSIRMPVLLEALQATHSSQGVTGLAAQLCEIEDRWQREDASAPAEPLHRAASLEESLGQLDLLLQEIRGDAESTPQP